MTARTIIERRIGRKLPPVSEMAPDERRAVKLLAIQLLRNKETSLNGAAKPAPSPTPAGTKTGQPGAFQKQWTEFARAT